MATVPTYREPQVREQALRPVMQNTPDVSSGLRAVASGLGQVGEAIDKIDLQKSQAAADQLDAQITTDWLKWDAENRNKFRGQNADGYEPAAQEWWKAQAERAGKDLSPRAQALANRALVRKQQTAMGNVVQFVGAERERHADEAAAASITSTIQFGVTTGDTAGAAAQVRDQVAKIGARKGWDTDQVKAEQLKNLSSLHLAQVTKLAAVDANAARAYYEANKSEVAAQNQPRVEEVLTGEADNQFATQFAAKNATMPYAEQIKAAGAIENPQRREKALIAIKTQQAQVREAQRANEEAASDTAWQAFAQGKRAPEAVLAAMDGKDRAQLVEAQRVRADRLAKGGAESKVKTDWNTYIDVREKLAAGERVDLRALTEKIAPAQLEQLLDIQTKTKSPTKAPEVASSEQQLSAFTGQMELKGERLGQFKSAAYDAFNDYLRRTGKEPDYEQRQKIMDSLTLSVVTSPGIIWDTKKPAYQAPRELRAPVVNDQFTTGKIYRDKNGAQAKYLGAGKWEPIK